MPCEHWKQMRLDRVNKKLSALQHTLYLAFNEMNQFVENQKDENDLIDGLRYNSEALEGTCELLEDIRGDISDIIDQIDEEQNPHLDIPDKI